MVKILICDDDQTFAQSMFKRILSLPAYSSKSMKLSCLTDIAEMSADTIAQYDILFLDIDLGKESGIDLARKMRKMNPEAVLIFVTNFSEYAPEGYEVDAFRYLAKSELEKKLPTYFEDALAMCRTRQRKVEILCEGESVPIPVQSLAWIESQGREQYLHLVGGCREQLITRLTMAQLEDLLVPHGFLRIHKSYLVNKLTIRMDGSYSTSGNSLTAFFSAMGNWSGTGSDPSACPSSGADVAGFHWGGNISTGETTARGEYGDNSSATVTLAGGTSNEAIAWYFTEKEAFKYIKNVFFNLNMSKSSLTGNGNTTELYFTYIHTYQSYNVTGSISASGAGISISNVANQWPLSVRLYGIPY